MRPGCWAARAAARGGTTGCPGRWASSRRRWGKGWGGPPAAFRRAPPPLADYLTQRSRPQLFSNALPPTVAGSALAAVRHVERHPELVRRLHEHASYFRGQLTALGFKPLPGETPIIPVDRKSTRLNSSHQI